MNGTDRELIRGRWKMTSSQRNGKERTFLVTEVVITADRMTFAVKPGEGADEGPADESMNLPYKLDPSKTPKAVDFKAENGETFLRIYSLDGDAQKACMAKPGAARPTEFETQPGSELKLIVLKRERP